MFLSKYFSGSLIWSSFEVARGYASSILGVPSTTISTELVSDHKEQIATRALQRLLQSRAPFTISLSCVIPSDRILLYFRSTKNNETDEWRESIVQSVHAHFLETRRSHRAPVCRIAYADICLPPQSHLTKKTYGVHGRRLQQVARWRDIETETHPPHDKPQTCELISSDMAPRDKRRTKPGEISGTTP